MKEIRLGLPIYIIRRINKFFLEVELKMQLDELFIEEPKGGKRKDDDKIISMLFDPIYRSMIGSDEGMPLVELLVSVVTDTKLSEIKGKVKHLSKELLKRHYKDMDSHVDVLLDYNNNKIIVEMNSKKIMIDRNYIYLFKVASGTLKVGDTTYKNIRKTVLINFNNTDKSQKNFIDIGFIKNQDNEIMTEIIKVINICIAKVDDKSYNYRNEFEKNMARICRILMATKASDLKKESAYFMTKEETKNFVNRAKELSSDDEMVTMFDQENMHEMIRNTELEEAQERGIERGIKRGFKEKALEIAQNMLKGKMDIKDISKFTGLSIEEIEKLKNNLN